MARYSRRAYLDVARILYDTRIDRVLKPSKEIGIADGTRETVRSAASLNTILDLQYRFADLFSEDSETFNREKFMIACRDGVK